MELGTARTSLTVSEGKGKRLRERTEGRQKIVYPLDPKATSNSPFNTQTQL